MRLLLDECVPARFGRALPSHQVPTVVREGWSGIKNGKLLALAAGRFDVLVTVDKNLSYQQDTRNLPVAVVVLDASLAANSPISVAYSSTAPCAATHGFASAICVVALSGEAR